MLPLPAHYLLWGEKRFPTDFCGATKSWSLSLVLCNVRSNYCQHHWHSDKFWNILMAQSLPNRIKHSKYSISSLSTFLCWHVTFRPIHGIPHYVTTHYFSTYFTIYASLLWNSTCNHSSCTCACTLTWNYTICRNWSHSSSKESLLSTHHFCYAK